MDIVELINKNWEKFVGSLKGNERNRVGLTLHRLKENLTRLSFRYDELVELETLMNQSEPDAPNRKKISLEFLQLKLVDKIEAFHQQVYSTISSLILVLNFIGIEGIKNHPINSVTVFLKHIKEKYRYRSGLQDSVDILSKAVDFRAKFIDHPQQHKLHNWMSMGYEGEYFIVYFIAKSDRVFFRGKPTYPLSPSFQPVVDCGNNFYVSPGKNPTFEAVKTLVRNLLNLQTSENDK